ncbi:hypothetical protein LLG95_10045 [bacterium]|nr:hypothetical protein [bacterium]
MNESPEINAASVRLIDEHLDAVEATLARGGTSRTERRRIIDELEVQIHDMLAARGESPTEEDVRELLAQLDPPQAYANGDEPAASRELPLQNAAPVERKFSITAVVGAIWAPFFFVTLIKMLIGFNIENYFTLILPTYLLNIGVLGVIGLLAPFGTTILGWVAVSQIRHSRGRVYGLGLALFDGLFFPLMLLDALFFVLIGIMFVHPSLGRITFVCVVLPIGILVSYFLDRLVIMDILQRVKKPI